MKEGTKTGDVVGRPSGRWLFLGDPGTLFFYGKLGTGTKKEKRSKKERKRRPVETDAADGNPLTTRIPTAAWKAQNAFHSSHKARRRFYRRDLIHQQGGAKSNDQKGPNQVDGSNFAENGDLVLELLLWNDNKNNYLMDVVRLSTKTGEALSVHNALNSGRLSFVGMKDGQYLYLENLESGQNLYTQSAAGQEPQPLATQPVM